MIGVTVPTPQHPPTATAPTPQHPAAAVHAGPIQLTRRDIGRMRGSVTRPPATIRTMDGPATTTPAMLPSALAGLTVAGRTMAGVTDRSAEISVVEASTEAFAQRRELVLLAPTVNSVAERE